MTSHWVMQARMHSMGAAVYGKPGSGPPRSLCAIDTRRLASITSRQREPPAHGNMAAGPHAVQSLSRCARFAPSSACATTGLLPHAQQRDGSSGSRSPGVSAAPAPALALGCVAAQDATLLRGGNRRGCAWCAKHPSSQRVRHGVQQPDKNQHCCLSRHAQRGA